MKKYYLIFLFFFLTNESFASIKSKIIQNLENTKNISFNFEQNINGKVETGKCTVQYPKKIFCKYELGNQKILVSDGNSLVIKTTSSYYLYPLDKTPLNFILDKEFLLMKIKKLNQNFTDNNFIIYKFFENENEINIVFNRKTHNLVGWQTIDIYQNLSITYLSSVIINQNIKKNLFFLPKE